MSKQHSNKEFLGNITVSDTIKILGATEVLVPTVEATFIPPSSTWAYILKVGSKIYISDYNGSLYTTDLNLNLLATDSVAAEGNYVLKHNPTLNRIYIGDYNATLFANYLDTTTGIITNVNTGSSTYRDIIDFNQSTQKIWAYDYSNNDIVEYDANYIKTGITFSTPFGFNGFNIAVNQSNDKIYVAGDTGFFGQAEILIYQPDSTLLNTIIRAPAGNSFGIAYDGDRDVVYAALGAEVIVIDGTTNLGTNAIDLTTYGAFAVQSIRYENGKITVGVIDSGFGGNGTILDIDPDTFAVTVIYGPFPNSRYTSGIYDGVDYYVEAKTDVIEKISVATGKLKSTVTKPDTQTLDTTHKLQDKDGILAHLADIPPLTIPTGNILWVDKQGNNGTAVPDDMAYPYNTIMGAINAANSGDLVVVRSGDYLESVVLKTGVNIHCMPGVQFGSTGGAGAITDNGVNVICRVTGYGTVNRRFQNNTVSFTGLNSKIYCEFYEILGAGIKLSIGTSASWAADIHIKCVNMRETAFNYILNKPRSALAGKFKLEVSGEIEILGAKGLVSFQSIGCFGTYTFLINRINFTASGEPSVGGTLLFGTNNQGQQSPIINVEIDEVIYNYDNASAFASYAFIHSGASDNGLMAWDLTLKINKPFVLKRRNLLRVQGTNTGITRLSVNVTGNEYQPLIYNNSATHKIFIHDSYLKKPNTGTDLNRIVTTVGDNSFVEYKNVVFHKDSLATDTGELIQLDGAGSTTIFKDCEIYLTGGGATGSVCDAATVPEGNVYFRNTVSNIDNTVNITDISLVSGFIGNDTNLNNYRI